MRIKLVMLILAAGLSVSGCSQRGAEAHDTIAATECLQSQVEQSVQELAREMDSSISSALQDGNELRAAQTAQQYRDRIKEAVCTGQSLTFEGEFLGIESLPVGFRVTISNDVNTQIPFLYVHDFISSDRYLEMLGDLSSGDSVRFTFLPKYNRQKVLDENPYTNGLALFLHIDLEEVSKIQDLSER